MKIMKNNIYRLGLLFLGLSAFEITNAQSCVTKISGPDAAIPGMTIKLKAVCNKCTSGVNLGYLWTGPGIVSGVTTNTVTVDEAGIYTAKQECLIGEESQWKTVGSFSVVPLSLNLAAEGSPVTGVMLRSTSSVVPEEIKWFRDGIDLNKSGETLTAETAGSYHAQFKFVSGSQTSYVNTNSKTITGEDLPCIEITQGQDVFIPGLTSKLRVNYHHHEPFLGYLWNGPNVIGSGGFAEVEIGAAGVYSVSEEFLAGPNNDGEDDGGADGDESEWDLICSFSMQDLELSLVAESTTLPTTFSIETNASVSSIMWLNMGDTLANESTNTLQVDNAGKYKALVTFTSGQESVTLATEEIKIGKIASIEVIAGPSVAIEGLPFTLGINLDGDEWLAEQDPSNPFIGYRWTGPAGKDFTLVNGGRLKSVHPGYYSFFGVRLDPDTDEEIYKLIATHYVEEFELVAESEGDLVPGALLEINTNYDGFTQIQWEQDQNQTQYTGSTLTALESGDWKAKARFLDEDDQEVFVESNIVSVIDPNANSCIVSIMGPNVMIPGMITRLTAENCEVGGYTMLNEYKWTGFRGEYGSDETFDNIAPGRYNVRVKYLDPAYNDSEPERWKSMDGFTIFPFTLDITMGGIVTEFRSRFLSDGASINLCISTSATDYISDIKWFKNGRLLQEAGLCIVTGQPGDYHASVHFVSEEQEITIESYKVRLTNDGPILHQQFVEGTEAPYFRSILNVSDHSTNNFIWYRNDEQIAQQEAPFTTLEQGFYMVSELRTVNNEEVEVFSKELEVFLPRLNYIKTAVVNKAGFSEISEIDESDPKVVSVSYEYFDGFTRKWSSVAKMASPELKDIVAWHEYDELGRATKKILPYVRNSNNGGFQYINIDDPNNELLQFYNNPLDNIPDTDFPYAETVLEPSPLNRVLQVGALGENYQIGSGHEVDKVTRTNFENEVLIWEQDPATGQLYSTGYYEPGELMMERTCDRETGENETCTEAFSDKDGQIVLSQILVENDEKLQTYQVYDEWGQLVAVIPPKALDEIEVSN